MFYSLASKIIIRYCVCNAAFISCKEGVFYNSLTGPFSWLCSAVRRWMFIHRTDYVIIFSLKVVNINNNVLFGILSQVVE